MPDTAPASTGTPARRVPRVCVVLPTHWAAVMGGSQYQAKLLIEHLLERYEAELYFLAARTAPGFEPHGYRIVKFSTLGGIRRYGLFFNVRRLYSALVQVRPDIIYQQVGCAYTGIAAHYARRNGARMVWRVTSDRSVRRQRVQWARLHYAIEQRFLEYGIEHADLILAQTETQKAELAANFGRSDALVVPNFHPVPPVDGSAEKPASPLEVVWIANFKPLKNPAAFVRLAKQFEAREDVRFVMVGAAGGRGRWLDEVMAAISAAPNVDYLGVQRQEEVGRLLERAHVLVNTSDYEGFSNTFIQAWMRRVPVVSLHVDPDGLLSQSGFGRVANDEQGLAQALRHLLECSRLRKEIGERARTYAIERHSTAAIDRVAALLGLEARAGRSPVAAVGPAAADGAQ